MQTYNPNESNHNVDYKYGQSYSQGQDFMNTSYGIEAGIRPEMSKTSTQSDYHGISKGLGLKNCITCILCLLLFYVVMFGPSAGDEYLNHGIKTTAVVTEVQEGIRHHVTYYGTYVDAAGAVRTAQIIANDFNTYEGKEVEGYYLSDKPNTVWCKPTGSVNFLLKGLACVLGLVGAIGLLKPVILAVRRR